MKSNSCYTKDRLFIKITGICGATEQAASEAILAKELGYDIGLVSLGGLNDWTQQQLIEHVTKVDIILVFGFYLQCPVGGWLGHWDV